MPSSLTPLIAIPAILLLTVLFQSQLSKNFDYQCANCGTRFSPSALAAALAPHRFGGLKLLRCPNCGQTTWASAVRKQQ
jgi:DNA-directed RNA polymerase subunit RPC12/RpoP